jgi:hypothetical protein
MFKRGDAVEIVSDGRVGIIKNTNGRIDAANLPGAVGVVERCLVSFGNDITKAEWFKPEQLRPAGKAVKTYTIHLCKKGKEFKAIANVADIAPRPSADKIIDEKWKVVGVISNSATDIVVDVEAV